MKFWLTCIITMLVLPLGGSTNAAADEGASDDVVEIKRILEEQERTIDELKARIGELEGETEASGLPPVEAEAPAPAVAASGEAPSPFEQAEEEMGLRHGHRAPITYRHTYTDRQADDAYHLSHYASANLMYQVFKRLSVGLEGLYGYKKVKSGSHTDVGRIQLGISYSIFD